MKSVCHNKDGENYKEVFSAFLKLLFCTFSSNFNFLYTGIFECVQQHFREWVFAIAILIFQPLYFLVTHKCLGARLSTFVFHRSPASNYYIQ